MDKYCIDCKYYVNGEIGTFKMCRRPGFGNNLVTGEPKTKLASSERISYIAFEMDSCGPDAKYFAPKAVVEPKLVWYKRLFN
jgi:hypothetical protein